MRRGADKVFMLLLDLDLMKVACPLLAAGYGVTDISRHFPPSKWFTFPTDGMKFYRVSGVEVEAVITKLGGVNYDGAYDS
jgi:hypothetical protein